VQKRQLKKRKPALKHKSKPYRLRMKPVALQRSELDEMKSKE
jgi:uncharacterized protein YjhX (UPF0386 family)